MSEQLLSEAERIHYMLRFPPGKHLVASFKNSNGNKTIRIIHYFSQADIPMSFVQRYDSFSETWYLYSVKSLETFEKEQEQRKSNEAIRRIADSLDSKTQLEGYV